MKNLIILFVAVCSILLTACSSNTPTQAVEDAFDALVSGDYETYVRSFYVEDKSDPEKVDREVDEFVQMIKRNVENNEDEKLKSYKILNEEKSKTGKWVRVSYSAVYWGGKETGGDLYLTKDDDGSWKILMFGTDRLMDE